MSVWSTTYYEDDVDTGERFGMCDECSHVLGNAPSEDLLYALALAEGWTAASTADGDTGVLACPDHRIEDSLRWYGVYEPA